MDCVEGFIFRSGAVTEWLRLSARDSFSAATGTLVSD